MQPVSKQLNPIGDDVDCVLCPGIKSSGWAWVRNTSSWLYMCESVGTRQGKDST